jgi:hypothetical protein
MLLSLHSAFCNISRILIDIKTEAAFLRGDLNGKSSNDQSDFVIGSLLDVLSS